MCGYALSLARRAKRIDTTCGGFYPLGTPVSTLGITRRRPETGDRSENGVRQSGYSTVSFVKYSQFTDTVLLHMRFTLRRRDIPVSRNSFARCYARPPANVGVRQHLSSQALSITMRYRIVRHCYAALAQSSPYV